MLAGRLGWHANRAGRRARGKRPHAVMGKQCRAVATEDGSPAVGVQQYDGGRAGQLHHAAHEELCRRGHAMGVTNGPEDMLTELSVRKVDPSTAQWSEFRAAFPNVASSGSRRGQTGGAHRRPGARASSMQRFGCRSG